MTPNPATSTPRTAAYRVVDTTSHEHHRAAEALKAKLAEPKVPEIGSVDYARALEDDVRTDLALCDFTPATEANDARALAEEQAGLASLSRDASGYIEVYRLPEAPLPSEFTINRAAVSRGGLKFEVALGGADSEALLQVLDFLLAKGGSDVRNALSRMFTQRNDLGTDRVTHRYPRFDVVARTIIRLGTERLMERLRKNSAA